MLRVGVLDGIVFVLSCTIGSGLFFAPAIAAKSVLSPYLAVAAWIIAGIISMAGSLVYAELGTSLVSSGAESLYLHKAFGPGVSFIFAWTLTTIIGSTACAVISRVMGSYIWAIFHNTGNDRFVNLSSIAIMFFLCFVNLINPNYVLMLNRFNVFCKALAVLTVVAGGAYTIAFGQVPSDAFIFESISSQDWNGFGTAVMVAAFALGGWNFLNPLAENMAEPEKNIPKVYLSGLGLTMVLAILVNVAFYVVLPLRVFEMDSNSLAGPFAAALVPGLKPVLCLLISFCCLGACNGIMMGTSRCIAGNGRDGILPVQLGYETEKHRIPFVSVIFFTIWTCIQLLVLSLNPEKAVDMAVTMYTVGQWSMFVLVGIALFVLRSRYPNLQRPYKIHFYPVLPAFFILVAIAVTIVTFKDWLSSLLACCIIVLGGIMYAISRLETVQKAYKSISLPGGERKFTVQMNDTQRRDPI